MEDSNPFVQKKSKIGFRKKEACMNCHHSIDNLSTVTRNLVQFNAGEVLGNAFTFRAIQEFPVKKRQKIGVRDFDLDFYQRPPAGLLTFRSLAGDLISKKLGSPSQLGTELAQLDDSYACAAKRYFNFFTGINVFLYDFNNFKVSEANQKYIIVRKFVLELGRKLKKHQSLHRTIEEIISSPYYKMGVEID